MLFYSILFYSIVFFSFLFLFYSILLYSILFCSFVQAATTPERGPKYLKLSYVDDTGYGYGYGTLDKHTISHSRPACFEYAALRYRRKDWLFFSEFPIEYVIVVYLLKGQLVSEKWTGQCWLLALLGDSLLTSLTVAKSGGSVVRLAGM